MYGIYVAGPIMAPENGGLPSKATVERRRARFGEVSDILRKQVGSATTVINPLDIPACDPSTKGPKCEGIESGPYGRKHTWRCFLRYDLQMLLMCNEIVMLEGWEDSPGATVEFNVANFLGLEVGFWCDQCQRTESDGPCKKESK